VNCHDVIFEIHHVVENQPLSLAYRMVTSYQLAQGLQMNILNMIPHVRNAFEGTSPSVVCIPLVPDAQDALGLAQITRRAGGRDRGSERERPPFIRSSQTGPTVNHVGRMIQVKVL
jgi:hypothetical protein